VLVGVIDVELVIGVEVVIDLDIDLVAIDVIFQSLLADG